ncbi:U32 family peptidase [Olsenella urininfantis]|uniref:U32 family peptidase n=1 Tax=Olsenella urininfantis TaxID=1871033 RepID=UPI001F219C53|nr:U32 family peptidase [Olsenella urininfantis]
MSFRDTHPVPELLAPAGGPEPFNAALAAGADAIYCALGSDFNARRGATNFTYETFEAACRAAHLAGSRVYVTVNVVIRTDEMPRVLALVRKAWLLGADAFIVQDWGLLAELRRRYPQIECHISTQANIHDARATAWCRDLGVSRVTLSRELSVDEISRIAQEGVELESFGHGALCFCYSGICMMSSLGGGRSANRGLCAQPCRLTYDLLDEQGENVSAPGRGRPLCPKDYCTVDDLPRLAAAGLGSLKIEGRMKAPDYVYSVVSSYRAQLDDLAAGRTPTAEELEARHQRLRRAFNRDFTNSYLDHRSDDDMMSYERSNNRGELVGSVVATRDLGGGKVRRGGANGGRERFRSKTFAEVDILLDKQVGEGDLLEIRPDDAPSQFLTTYAPQDARAGDTICCRTVRPMEPGCPVRVIRSQQALDEAARVSGGNDRRRRPVELRVQARLGQLLSIELRCVDGSASVRVEGFEVEPARTRPVSEDDLAEHAGRMGQSPFLPVSFDIELDEGCGMAFSAVHKLRSRACELLEEELLRPSSAALRKQGLARVPDVEDIAAHLEFIRGRGKLGEPRQTGVEICALVASPASAGAALASGATRLYVTPDAFEDARSAGLAWPEGAYLVPWLDEVCRECDHERLDPYVRTDEPCAVGNMSELVLAARVGALAEVRPCIPVHNESCLVELEEQGASGVWLSPELTLEEVCALAAKARVPVGLVVSGRARAMTSEHCVLQVANRCIHDCARCRLRQKRCSLRGKDGSLWPVRTDLRGRSNIFAASPLDATPQMVELVSAGVSRVMADCTLLSAEEAASAVARVVRAVDAARQGRKPAARLAGSNSGHLFAGIS